MIQRFIGHEQPRLILIQRTENSQPATFSRCTTCGPYIHPTVSETASNVQLVYPAPLSLPVAMLEDILQGKIWAAQDLTRHPSKRRKDLLDIERIVEGYPAMRARVPADILDRLKSP